MLRIEYAPFRLLFHRPFGTAHGIRTGTDSIFVRVSGDGVVGHGEATLPPYLKETPASVVERLRSFQALGPLDLDHALSLLGALEWEGSSGGRAALHTALTDASYKKIHSSVCEAYMNAYKASCRSTMTISLMEPEEIAAALTDLPHSDILKVKVNGIDSSNAIKVIQQLDTRLLMIDSNQGLQRVEDALALLRSARPGSVLAMEQPFQRDQLDKHRELAAGTSVRVYADESIQDGDELEERHGAFGGVNLKLMKCGGLDEAHRMMARARELGLGVMLGSMSESSLGCTAMAQLADGADIVDLDGPWLITNDPFVGITMEQGRIQRPDGPGLGVRPRFELDWQPLS